MVKNKFWNSSKENYESLDMELNLCVINVTQTTLENYSIKIKLLLLARGRINGRHAFTNAYLCMNHILRAQTKYEMGISKLIYVWNAINIFLLFRSATRIV